MKHFLSISDIDNDQVARLIDIALELKSGRDLNSLAGKSIALLFDKPSLRTRMSFEIGIQQLGGHSIYLGREEIGMGVREPVEDVARVVSRYADAMVVRTFAQEIVETLALYSSIPVINALTDGEHPCQALADILTVYEKKGTFKGIGITYIGDGNNVAASLAIAAVSVGANISVASPPGYELSQNVIDECRLRSVQSGGTIYLTSDPEEASKDADVIYTDVWVSMGQESESNLRRKVFEPYRIDDHILSLAADSVLFMHPLPAHPGEEIVDGLLDLPQSVVFDQAENRLHAQKAVLSEVMR